VDTQDRPLITGAAATWAGRCYTGECVSYDSFVARLTAAGDVDPGFGSTGVVSDPSFDGAGQPTIGAGARVFYLGTTGGGRGTFAKATIVARGADGEQDPKWGSVDLGIEDEVADVKIGLDPLGRMLVAEPEAVPDVLSGEQRLRRFLPDGRLDESFGVSGEAAITDPRLVEIAALAMDRRGRPLLVGWNGENDSSFRLGRRDADGGPDLGFGRRGVATTAFAGAQANPDAVLVDHHGRILVAGALDYRDQPGRTEFAIVRFLGG
jgi:hypothetical protein